MGNDAVRVAVLADTHLGYAAKVRTHPATGLNERVRDGMLAMRETVDQILAADVDVVVHAGDLFHKPWPAVAEIVWAKRQLDRFAAAGIPVVVSTGNHDAASERGRFPATAAIHDPDRGITAVTDPLAVFRPDGLDGLAVTVLTHYGLARAERLVPDPVDGEVNLLTAHGAAMLPGHEVFRCADSPGELPIGLDILTNPGWAAVALGHYHGQGPLPGLGRQQVWYAGSALRRGFADGPGGRGWLLLQIAADGTVTITPQFIAQRPQYDLPVIDAAGLTGDEVHERVRAHLGSVDVADAIVRQVVINVTGTHRAGMRLPALADAASSALQWMPVLRRPEPVPLTLTTDGGTEATVTDVAGSLRTARAADLPVVFGGYVSDWAAAAGVAAALIPAVTEDGQRHLRAAAGITEPVHDDTAALPPTPGPVPAGDPGIGHQDSADAVPVADPFTVEPRPAVAPRPAAAAADYDLAAPDETDEWIDDLANPDPGDTDPLIDAVTGQAVPW